MITDADRTLEMLLTISSHLSSRESCRFVEYVVTISGNKSQKVSFDPETYVFPDRYRRKSLDRESIVSHVLLHHFPELIQRKSAKGEYYLKPKSLVNGTYVYRLSYDRRSRKWDRKYL